MNPILGQRPSKLRKEWNFAKFKQILGQHQNKLEEKMNPFQTLFSKIGLALRLGKNFGDSWGNAHQKKVNKRELLDAGTHQMNPKTWIKGLFLQGFPHKFD